MHSLRLTSAAGQPSFRPSARRADLRPRATPSTATTAPTASGPFANVPLWCIPALIFSAAMPFYGMSKTEKMINEGRAKAAVRIAADKDATTTKPAPKSAKKKWVAPVIGSTTGGLLVATAVLLAPLLLDKKDAAAPKK